MKNLWDKFFEWSRKSATLVWAHILIALGVVVGVLLPILDALEALDISSLVPPKYAMYTPWMVFIIGLVTRLCRMRSGGMGFKADPGSA